LKASNKNHQLQAWSEVVRTEEEVELVVRNLLFRTVTPRSDIVPNFFSEFIKVLCLIRKLIGVPLNETIEVNGPLFAVRADFGPSLVEPLFVLFVPQDFVLSDTFKLFHLPVIAFLDRLNSQIDISVTINVKNPVLHFGVLVRCVVMVDLDFDPVVTWLQYFLFENQLLHERACTKMMQIAL